MNHKKATRGYKAIEEDYQEHGLNNYELQNTTDLLKIHSIDYMETKGFNNLDERSKKLYEKFIINYYNSISLFFRDITLPIEISQVDGINIRPGEKCKGLLLEWTAGNIYGDYFIEDENTWY